MTSELRFIIDGQHLERVDNNIISSGSVAVPVAIFENMRGVWSGYSAFYAEFTQGDVTIKVTMTDTDRCYVPHETLGEGYVSVSVYAETAEGNVITTDTVDVEIKRGPSRGGDNTAELTPDDKTQMQTSIEKAFDTAKASFEIFSDLETLKKYPQTTRATAVRFIWAGEDTEYPYADCTAPLVKYGVYDGDFKTMAGRVFKSIIERVVLSGGGGDIDVEALKSLVDEYLAGKSFVEKEEDPTVPDWAKHPDKPTYTAEEVGALPSDTHIPSKTSDLENDSNFIDKTVDDLANYYLKDETYTREEVKALLSAIPKFAIQPVDELPTEDISTTTVYLLKYSEDAQDLYQEYIYVNGAWEYLGSQKVDLSGYAKLTDIPTLAQLGGITEVKAGQLINVHNNSDKAHADIRELINKKAGKDEIPTVPTDVSSFNNDAGFITKAVSDLVNYYTKDNTYTQTEVNALVSAIPKFSIEVVSELPTANISTTTVYLLGGGSGDDLYTEYIYVDGKWEILGSQRVDLTGYATEAWVNIQLGSYLKQTALTEAINTALAQAKTSGEFDGKDGVTPNIGDNGNWWIGGIDTGITAWGTVIQSTRIDEDGYLIITYTDGSNQKAGLVKGTSVTVKKVTESNESGGSNTIEFSDGKILTVKNGKDGKAYTLTEADKSSIASAVKASLTTENWTFELEDGNTVTKAVLLG